MPDESCRKCGGVLVNCTQCAECKETISMICQNCGLRTMEQFHGYCMFHVNNVHGSGLENDQNSEYVRVSAFAWIQAKLLLSNSKFGSLLLNP